MSLLENIRLAFRAIASNKLRTALTLLIIAFGIMALIGIITAAEGIKASMLQSFSEMGSNTFNIKNEGTVRRRHGRREVQNPNITLAEALRFKNQFNYPAVIAVSGNVDFSAVIKHESRKTNPNVVVLGADENYLKVSGQNIAAGRNFTKRECDNGTDIILLGRDVVARLYTPTEQVLGSLVNIGNKKYRVVGLMAPKGASKLSSDNQVIIPVVNGRRTFPSSETSYAISVMVKNPNELDAAIDEATGVMRAVRKLAVSEENDFSLGKSDRLANQFIEQMSQVKGATVIIGILTLIGAGVGLMNIMLVAVNERTREIGLSKAIGATKRTIRIRFLTESVLICLVGGTFGIVLGVLIGNVVGIFLNTGFIMPWNWVFAGLFFTFIIGIASGWLPARKASQLDPVEALRYE